MIGNCLGGNGLILYHGSDKEIDNPSFDFENPNNDFGKGLYCTKNEKMGKLWACSNEYIGYCNKYLLNDLRHLNIFKINKEHEVLTWLAILIKNREFNESYPDFDKNKKYIINTFYPQKIENYDVIIGPRADDKFFSFAKDFLADIIGLNQLQRAMELNDYGDQIVIKSKKGFDHIKFLGVEKVTEKYLLNERLGREKQANEMYFKIRDEGKNKSDLTASQIREVGLINEDFFIFR